MLNNETVQMVTQPKLMSMISVELTRSYKPMSPIAKFVAIVVRQEAGKVEYVKKKERGIEVTRLHAIIRPIGLRLV